MWCVEKSASLKKWHAKRPHQIPNSWHHPSLVLAQSTMAKVKIWRQEVNGSCTTQVAIFHLVQSQPFGSITPRTFTPNEINDFVWSQLKHWKQIERKSTNPHKKETNAFWDMKPFLEPISKLLQIKDKTTWKPWKNSRSCRRKMFVERLGPKLRSSYCECCQQRDNLSESMVWRNHWNFK